MQYRQLGRSGLKISPICLGTMMFGGPTDEATSSRIVAKAREAGVNFIDSADAYNGGKSEQVVGRAISNNRQNWILATKLANQIGEVLLSKPRVVRSTRSLIFITTEVTVEKRVLAMANGVFKILKSE